MNTIFGGHTIPTAFLQEIFHDLEIDGLVALETFGIVHHKEGILWGGNFIVDVG